MWTLAIAGGLIAGSTYVFKPLNIAIAPAALLVGYTPRPFASQSLFAMSKFANLSMIADPGGVNMVWVGDYFREPSTRGNGSGSELGHVLIVRTPDMPIDRHTDTYTIKRYRNTLLAPLDLPIMVCELYLKFVMSGLRRARPVRLDISPDAPISQ